jgi:hypothetical protein
VQVRVGGRVSTARKRLRLSDDDGGDNDLSEEEMEEQEEEEVSSEESSMNQLDTSEEKLLAKHDRDLFFGNNGHTTSLSSEPHTLETSSSCVCSNPNGSDDDDLWM